MGWKRARLRSVMGFREPLYVRIIIIILFCVAWGFFMSLDDSDSFTKTDHLQNDLVILDTTEVLVEMDSINVD